jgi:carbonyl reductase 1
VNNAGFAFKGDTFGAAEARTTIACNVYGTMAVTDALLPLLRSRAEGARIVNVCSQAGRLVQVSPALRARFSDSKASAGSVKELCEEFIAAVESGDYAMHGWPRSMYGISKV